ncbi:thiamine pyrophosphate-binding protein [Polymorphobacter sp. PAMC 29334]|uniref:thiamine pyrophosphate-binding protein n=1 Tax=Polymorphobacter sp. PAMC 29334 TaxID=2862331 RepID=UPI001C768645|nr:thiamine pyrophosphate-binding protein [Polymorphobacter sp. PAMC 29334]QYE33934.1 thiamine pyrophosphate-binding protein [Polymorphobacter sp. PAMC 29334]
MPSTAPDPRSLKSVIAAKLLARSILATGTATVFALAGATHAPLLMALEDGGATIIGGRHESGTVGAADGYARRTGRIGIALIVAEQGLQNALTAIMTAAQANSPIVVIATRFPDSWIEPAISYAVDRHELTAPAIKFSRTVPSADRLAEYFAAACKAATEGVPGPSLLVLPMDMMTQDVADVIASPPVAMPLPPARIEQIAEAVAMIAAADRPIVVVDGGAARGDAGAGLRALAALGVPVLGNALGRGLVPEVAPTGYPWPYAQRAAAQADVVIIVGAEMSMWFGYGKAPRFATDARFIHIDDNARAIGRNIPVELPIVAHIGDTVTAIADTLAADGYRGDPSWLTHALAERAARVDSFVDRAEPAIHQIEIGAALDAALPEDRLLVGDGADILNFTFARLRLHQPRSYADHLPLGAMGMGFPLAVGMAAGEADLARDRGGEPAPTVLVSGDGAIGFFLAELDTIRRAALHLIVVVSNDSKWGTEYHGQQLAYGRTTNTELGASDYAAIARAFGCAGESVSDRPALKAAIIAAVARPGPTLIDVQVDPMGGAVRKVDPLLGMILFEDIAKKT